MKINSAFECADGSLIHFSNVREMEVYFIDDTPVITINGHRILNNKSNRKVSKLCDAYLKVNNYKTVVKYVKMTDEELDVHDYETVICD